MMQEVEVLKTIQELICSFFPKNSLHYRQNKMLLQKQEEIICLKWLVIMEKQNSVI